MNYMTSKAWPYEEARKLLDRPAMRNGTPMIFETGYGPSGLPHIGTFCEVLRTQMVRKAFEDITDGHPTRLIVFSDDLDGMRKVPENVPNQEMLKAYVGVSLTRVPDPYGCCESFGQHNNAQLCSFLDRFGFDYEFTSATEMYKSNEFAGALRVFHLNHDVIRDIIVPTLGKDRASTYSPFLPIDPHTGEVYQAEILRHNIDAETLTYCHPHTGEEVETSILNGACKLQWKADWAMRWLALEVDYEMCGKDLTDSVTLSSQIIRHLGSRSPEGMIYEMFLDEHGRKISKSVGNGLTIDQWLTYSPQSALAFYLFRNPRKANKLGYSLIPRAIDDYLRAVRQYPNQSVEEQLGNPAHHVHAGNVPVISGEITFGLLLNLIGILGDTDAETVWNYIVENYDRDAPIEISELIPYALAYHRDHVAKDLVYRPATALERAGLISLCAALQGLSSGADETVIQTAVYEQGKASGYAENLREWFKAIYEIVFGSPDGPRLGTFIAVYGIEPFIELLEVRLSMVNPALPVPDNGLWERLQKAGDATP